MGEDEPTKAGAEAKPEPTAEQKVAAAATEETGQPTEAEDMISKANAAAARLEEANTETARLNTEAAALKVQTTLGGKTEAGTGEKKEDTPEEYMKKVMANEIETKE